MTTKVLIIKLGALGDVIIATPHIEQIVAAHRDEEITLLTAPAYSGLFHHHPRLKVIAYDRRGPGAMLNALVAVRRQRFECVYDLQGSERSMAVTLCTGAGMRAGLGPGWIYTHTVEEDDEDRQHTHIFNRLNNLLQTCGIEPARPRPVLFMGAAERQRVLRWLDDHRLSPAQFAVFHAGSSARWQSKRWEQAYFAALAGYLRDHGITVVWVGGEEERELNRQLAATGIDATGEFSLLELCALGCQARFALVNDSGPMHVLSAAGIPVYAFFGPTNWRRSHAVGQQSRVLTNAVSCSPCHLRVCPPDKGHACLSALTPEQVLARLESDGVLSG